MDTAHDRIHELEDWTEEFSQNPGKKGLDWMKEKSRELEARARWSNISLTGGPEGENEKKGKEDKL